MTASIETGQDEYVVDNPRLRAFVAEVSRIRHQQNDPRQILAAIRPHFAELLADKTWLPEQYQEPAADSGMGSGIGTWLLYRAGDGGLALSALVVPPGAQTPVHDHLAWGLVGLYRGTQDEDVFTRTDDGSSEDQASLTIAESRALQAGDFYELLPETDIHRVRTTSPEPSVSIHLLTNDTGCVWRHAYDERSGEPSPFRSGYVNVACDEAPE